MAPSIDALIAAELRSWAAKFHDDADNTYNDFDANLAIAESGAIDSCAYMLEARADELDPR